MSGVCEEQHNLTNGYLWLYDFTQSILSLPSFTTPRPLSTRYMLVHNNNTTLTHAPTPPPSTSYILPHYPPLPHYHHGGGTAFTIHNHMYISSTQFTRYCQTKGCQLSSFGFTGATLSDFPNEVYHKEAYSLGLTRCQGRYGGDELVCRQDRCEAGRVASGA